MIRSVAPGDALAIAGIYNHYVNNTTITFEETPVEPNEMRERMDRITQTFPWFVSTEGDTVTGYCYANTWKARSAYRFTVETTIYLDPNQKGKGLGSALYDRLIQELKAQEIHSLIGVVALPNQGSVQLHEKFGFEKAAHFKEVGKKFDQWIDVGYWQRILQAT